MLLANGRRLWHFCFYATCCNICCTHYFSFVFSPSDYFYSRQESGVRACRTMHRLNPPRFAVHSGVRVMYVHTNMLTHTWCVCVCATICLHSSGGMATFCPPVHCISCAHTYQQQDYITACISMQSPAATRAIFGKLKYYLTFLLRLNVFILY